MIAKIREFVNMGIQWVKAHEDELILGLGVALLSLLSFAGGDLVAKEHLKEPLQIEQLRYEVETEK